MPVHSNDGAGPLRDVLDAFALVSDPVDRANLLISFADQFRPCARDRGASYPREHLVPYCESEAYVWLVPQDDGSARLYFAVRTRRGSPRSAGSRSWRPPCRLRPRSSPRSPRHRRADLRPNISMGKGMGLMR